MALLSGYFVISCSAFVICLRVLRVVSDANGPEKNDHIIWQCYNTNTQVQVFKYLMLDQCDENYISKKHVRADDLPHTSIHASW